MSSLPIVSIIIVDFFKAPRVVENVKAALLQQGDFRVEVIVIDNSCNENNQRELKVLDGLPGVTLIFNNSNAGYVGACNQGFKLCKGEYIFLVNPDIVWMKDNVLSKVVGTFSTEGSIGIIGVRQENDDGTTPETVRRFPDLLTQIARRTFLRDLPWLRSRVAKYEVTSFDYSVSADVDWVQSSFMAITRDVWLLLGGLDKRFFLFMSDPDICYRAWGHNYRVFYQSDVLVGADGKRCSEGGIRDIFTSKAIRYHLRDAIYYQFKYLLKRKKSQNRIGD